MIDEKTLLADLERAAELKAQISGKDKLDISYNYKDIRNFIENHPKSSAWISCDDRLPEEPFGCLVTVIDTNPMTLEDFENILPYHVGYSEGQWNDKDGEQIPFEVVAWQPLPEPYKLEE